MRRLTISENHNLYTVEVSDGRKASGATLESALSKLFRARRPYHDDDSAYETVEEFFRGIVDTPSGQIAHGQASG